MKILGVAVLLYCAGLADAFVPASTSNGLSTTTSLQQSAATSDELKVQKKKLLELIGKSTSKDPVLADPITKEAVQISVAGVLIGGEGRKKNVQYSIQSPTNKYAGSSDTFLNLLQPITDSTTIKSDDDETPVTNALRRALPLVPIFLRGPLSSLTKEQVIPMRDLFTSPAVSYAYERGWRAGFAAAGFPGADTEAQMAADYFAPVVARAAPNSVVVDMSCATGLFTRRFAASEKYGRVLGCDYSESMLTEARRRIRADTKLSSPLKTRLDLVRLDVGQIPMQDASVDSLHAGAAMHCWPELDVAMSEIYRVLKPGGRYFATTFLSTYFATLQSTDGASEPSQQAFQYFRSVNTLRELVEVGGFKKENITIEVLGTACVVIRAEK